ncbi:pseudouridine-5'-phosphatase-like [Ischnura elegans]|uniref:pseudouridine-5'-phosphatase-like n=1 Tax=Ischnura elegans TaxID=197161 RepID=UPI001ED8803D|nr:pseudouridine-5'-phosphatase-like [Ischnura elegans]
MTAFREVTHVIFDMDGLLLNTEHLYTRATQEICDPYGKKYTWGLKQTLMGMTGPDVAKKITKELDLPISPEEYMKLATEKYEKLFPQSEMMPGAEKLVRHLKKEGVHIAVATSSSIESYNLKTNHHKEFFGLFEHIVNGSSDPEVKAGKPDPSIFLVCASRFADKPAPEQCLVLEDSPNGVEAALAAGMQVVMVPDPHIDESLTHRATLTLSSLEELRPELFGLPPFPS